VQISEALRGFSMSGGVDTRNLRAVTAWATLSSVHHAWRKSTFALSDFNSYYCQGPFLPTLKMALPS
jgi:hypothetical protein